jgi:hypothetical protein
MDGLKVEQIHTPACKHCVEREGEIVYTNYGLLQTRNFSS